MKKISTFEYNTLIWFIIRACFTELTLTSIIYHVNQDTWISIIFGIILGLIPFSIFEYLKQKFPDKNIISINNQLWNNFGKIINLIIFISSLFFATFTFWILIRFTNTIFLYKTNLWIVSISLIIPIGYASTKKINIISKISLMLFYASVIIYFLIFFNLIGNIDISNIKPIFENSIPSIFKCSLILTSTNILKLYYLNMIPKEKILNYSSKNSLITYLISSLSILVIAIIVICIFGINLAKLYEYPAFQILKQINFLGIFDRIENILSIEAIFAIFIEIIVIIHYLNETITTSVNKKTNKYVILICLFIFITSNIIFINYKSGEAFFSGPTIYITLLSLLFLPLITFAKSLLY